ncbi:hypothetical protein SAY86_005488 [Trapa natans]|uniref:Uncharacterized protein n=1 Tax=Trapa natans TaxID=22666 RepID=A0AAN7L812_TRANT|nr:hypothetical protein SAY86_005488 [Trapa natans]
MPCTSAVLASLVLLFFLVSPPATTMNAAITVAAARPVKVPEFSRERTTLEPSSAASGLNGNPSVESCLPKGLPHNSAPSRLQNTTLALDFKEKEGLSPTGCLHRFGHSLVPSLLNADVADGGFRALFEEGHSYSELFSLSVIDEDKVAIGAAGSIPALGNKVQTIKAGIMGPLMGLLRDTGGRMVDEAPAILSILVSHPEGKAAIGLAQPMAATLLELFQQFDVASSMSPYYCISIRKTTPYPLILFFLHFWNVRSDVAVGYGSLTFDFDLALINGVK